MSAFDLLSLPIEILDLVLSFPSSSHLTIRLWKCGDSRLCSKIHQGVTKLSLSHSPLLVSRCPRMVSNFGSLRCLHIASKEDLMPDPRDWAPWLNTLPKTLEELHIVCEDAGQVFLNFAPLGAQSDVRARPSLIQTAYHRGTSDLIDIGRLFPQLHSLKLQTSHRPLPRFNLIEPSDYPALPSTLTYLSVNPIYMRKSTKLMSLLPPSLTNLDARIKISDQPPDLLDWQHFPPYLTRIESIEYSGKDLTFLPPTLEDVNFGASAFTTQMALRMPHLTCLHAKLDLPPSGADLPLLIPHKVTILSINQPQLLPYLPGCLVELTLEITDTSFRSWFKAVTKTKAALESFGEPTLARWPSTLQKLKYFVQKIDPLLICAIPPSLTQLEIRTDEAEAGAPELILSTLPPNLVVFHLTVFNGRVSSSIRSPLPPSLTHFEFVTDEGGLESNSLHFLLGTALKILKVTFSSLGTDPCPLPSSLTSINLHTWHMEWFSAIPKSTLSLIIINLRLKSEPSQDISHRDIFADLPPTLQRLDIRLKAADSPTMILSSQCFSSLPALTLPQEWPNSLLLCSKTCQSFATCTLAFATLQKLI